MGPASITEADFRVVRANISILNDAVRDLGMRDGIGAPKCYGVADDKRHFLVAVPVRVDKLPKDKFLLRSRLEDAVLSAATALVLEMDPKDIAAHRSTDLVDVEFTDISNFDAGPRRYAEFKDGRLTFF